MKIFLISRGFPSKDDPQWGSFEYDQALALKSLGHEVIFLSVEARFRKKTPKLGYSFKTIEGFKYLSLFIIPSVFFSAISHDFWYQTKQYLMLKLYQCAVRKFGKPDIIYAHYFTNIVAASCIKEKFNIPIVGIEHWSIMKNQKLPSYVMKWGHISYRKIDKLITVSSSLQENIQKHFNIDSVVIPNMINALFLNENIQRKQKESFTFISIGNLLPVKGFDCLIKAFDKSNLHSKDVKLVIVGGGSEYDNLNNLIRKLNLTDSIYLTGRKNRDEVFELLNTSDVFVLTSRSETFGVVFIEAMSQGLPIIATKCGGPEEFTNSKNGILVEVDNINSISKSLVYMYDNLDNFDRTSIRNNILNNYSPISVGNKIISLFNDVLKEKK